MKIRRLPSGVPGCHFQYWYDPYIRVWYAALFEDGTDYQASPTIDAKWRKDVVNHIGLLQKEWKTREDAAQGYDGYLP